MKTSFFKKTKGSYMNVWLNLLKKVKGDIELQPLFALSKVAESL